MVTLTRKDGEAVLCDSVVRGRQQPFLFIHTNALSWPEACIFFGDPEATAELTAVERFSFPAQTEDGKTEEIEAENTTVYRGYTRIHCIQEDPLIDTPGELMIWLDRPEE